MQRKVYNFHVDTLQVDDKSDMILVLYILSGKIKVNPKILLGEIETRTEDT